MLSVHTWSRPTPGTDTHCTASPPSLTAQPAAAYVRLPSPYSALACSRGAEGGHDAGPSAAASRRVTTSPPAVCSRAGSVATTATTALPQLPATGTAAGAAGTRPPPGPAAVTPRGETVSTPIRVVAGGAPPPLPTVTTATRALRHTPLTPAPRLADSANAAATSDAFPRAGALVSLSNISVSVSPRDSPASPPTSAAIADSSTGGHTGAAAGAPNAPPAHRAHAAAVVAPSPPLAVPGGHASHADAPSSPPSAAPKVPGAQRTSTGCVEFAGQKPPRPHGPEHPASPRPATAP